MRLPKGIRNYACVLFWPERQVLAVMFRPGELGRLSNPNASSAAYKAFEQVCRRDAKGAADPISQRLAVRSPATSPKLAATSPKLSDNHCYFVSHCASRSKRVTLVEYYSSKQTEVQFEIRTDSGGFWLGEPGQTSI